MAVHAYGQQPKHGGLAELGNDDHPQYPLKSIATTKGDVWVATAAGVLVRLGVGANNTVLTADSAEATGVKWAAASAVNTSVFEGWSYPAGSITTDTELYRRRGNTTAAQVSTVPAVAHASGSIVGISAGTDTARTAGTLTLTVWKNGVSTGLSCVFDGTKTTYTWATQAAGTDTFVAGDYLDVRGTNASYTGGLYVEQAAIIVEWGA